MANPIAAVYVDNVDVAKDDVRGFFENRVPLATTAAEVQATDLGATAAIVVGGILFRIDTADTISADNYAQPVTAATVLVSSNGNRYKPEFAATPADGLPTGGTAGQILEKASNADYDADWQSRLFVPAGGSTGQVLTRDATAYAWADVATGSGVPDGGTTGQVLTKNSNTDGDASWQTPSGGGGGGDPAIIKIDTTGTYTPTPGARFAIVDITGGGGGGGGARATGSGETAAGGGGGGGGTSRKIIDLDGVTSVLVTIGLGGIGVTGEHGTDGGDTSFGAVFSATGGGFGWFANGTTGSLARNGGGGGDGVGGDINAGGMGGSSGIMTGGTLPRSGDGGSSGLGYGGGAPGKAGGAGVSSAGAAGGNYGGGGSGGANGNNKAAQPGGDGAPGVCYIQEIF